MAVQVAPPPTRAADARTAGRQCWAVCAALLAAVAANAWAELPWVPEAIYLGSTAAAAAITAHRLLWQWVRGQRPGQLPLLAAAAAALALIALCLPADALLCAAAGPWLGTVPLLFLGSDLGFAAILALDLKSTVQAQRAAAMRGRKAD